jgi:hypothetical protein
VRLLDRVKGERVVGLMASPRVADMLDEHGRELMQRARHAFVLEANLGAGNVTIVRSLPPRPARVLTYGDTG